MKRLAGEGLSPERRRRLLQIIFVFVNLALVETHLPGPLWLAIGAIFWLALIGITIAGSNLVCGTMCWIGAIQDFFEPFAHRRLQLDASLGKALTLVLLVVWMPIGWLVLPTLAAHDRTPLNFSFGWERHLFGFVLAATVAGSVVFLGKRGICRYLCPFNSIVAAVRRVLRGKTAAPVAASKTVVACAGACVGCNGQLGTAPIATREREMVT